MTLWDIIRLKFPQYDLLNKVKLQNDGQEDYIVKWELDEPIEIDKWREQVSDLYIFEQNKINNAPKYKELEEIDLKTIRALRTNDTARLQQLEQKAVQLRNNLLPVQ